MELTHHSKTGYDQEPVSMPTEGIGSCKNVDRCKNFLTDLANSYCVECWDRGLGSRRKGMYHIENVEEPTIKKSRRTSISLGGNKWLI